MLVFLSKNLVIYPKLDFMKFILSVLLLVSSTVISQLDAQNNEAIAYFDYFNQQHAQIVQSNFAYIQAMIHTEEVAPLAQKRLALLTLIEQSQTQCSSLPAYAKDQGMKAAMQQLLSTYQGLYQVDYLEIEALKPTAKSSYEKMEHYIQQQTKAELALVDASIAFLEAQKNFAAANNIIIVEGSPKSEIEQMNQLNAYQRDLFLSLFKVNQLNAHFLEAVQQHNATAAQLYLDELVLACKDEYSKIRYTSDFNGHTAYRDAIVFLVKKLNVLAHQDYPLMLKVAAANTSLSDQEIKDYNELVAHLNTDLMQANQSVQESLLDLLRSNVPKASHRAVKQI